MRRKLKARGIATEVYYPRPIHRQPLYQKLGYRDHLPESEKASAEVLSLPVHPGLSAEDLKAITEALAGA